MSLTALTAAAASADNAPAPRYAFVPDGESMHYAAEAWSIHAEGERGWTSLRVHDGEFLHTTDTVGGIVFRRDDDGAWVTRFPERSNLSHDRTVGRFGQVADGMFMIKVTPDQHGPSFQLYAGFNDQRRHTMVIYLSDEVAMVRENGSERTWSRRWTAPGRDASFDTKHGVVLVHRDGYAITTDAPCHVGPVAHPAGGERLALSFACEGFAANAFQFRIEPTRQPDGFIFTPSFDVQHDGDAGFRGLGATHGVKNPIYERDSEIDFKIRFTWHGPEPFEGVAELEVVHSLGQRHFHQRVPVRSAAVDAATSDTGHEIVARFDPRFTLPGVSEVWGRLIDASGRVIWIDRYRMGFALEAYEPVTHAPADLRSFWDRTLEALRAEPLDAEAQRVFEDHPDFEIYHVTYNSLEGQRIHAMLYVPRQRTGPLPAIVTAHPGLTGFGVNRRADGTYGSKLKLDPRFVTIIPLIRGHAPDADDIPFNHPGWGPIENRDTYAARYWYCAMVRAIDYLATRPDLVDMSRIVARGGSQGGALALAAAALDDRVALCLADSPPHCQLREIVLHYPSFGPTRGQVRQGQTLEDMLTILDYFDPVHLAPWIRCPTYIGCNIGDLTVHAMGPLAAYHNLTALDDDHKGFYPGPTHFHANSREGSEKFRAELDRIAGQRRQ